MLSAQMWITNDGRIGGVSAHFPWDLVTTSSSDSCILMQLGHAGPNGPVNKRNLSTGEDGEFGVETH